MIRYRVVARDPERPGVVYLLWFPRASMAASFVERLAQIGCSGRAVLR